MKYLDRWDGKSKSGKIRTRTVCGELWLQSSIESGNINSVQPQRQNELDGEGILEILDNRSHKSSGKPQGSAGRGLSFSLHPPLLTQVQPPLQSFLPWHCLHLTQPPKSSHAQMTLHLPPPLQASLLLLPPVFQTGPSCTSSGGAGQGTGMALFFFHPKQ